MGSFEEKLSRICMYLNHRVKTKGERNGKSFKVFKKKTFLKRLSFIAQFKIEILLPFTGCREALEKMPDQVFKDQLWLLITNGFLNRS